jgi:hypothetical protein
MRTWVLVAALLGGLATCLGGCVRAGFAPPTDGAGAPPDATADAGPPGDALHPDLPPDTQATPPGVWTAMPSGTTEDLRGIWGSSTGDVWVVGDQGTILHHGGWSTGWNPDVVPPGASDLTDVHGTAVDDVWAVGQDGQILHRDAAGWSFTPQSVGLWSVRAVGPTDVYAFGEGGKIIHFDGASWMPASVVGNCPRLVGAWVSGASDVWAVGFGGMVVSYDGDGWNLWPSAAGITQNLYAVWGDAKTGTIYAVGDDGNVLRHDGASWSLMAKVANASLQGIWGSSASDIWVVGLAGTVLHFDGQAWQSWPNVTAQHLYAVWGDAQADKVFAVGAAGTILRYSSGN